MKRILAIIVILVLTGAAGGWYFLNPGSSRVETTRLLQGPAVQAVYATGTVEPSVMIPIAPRQAARLMSLMADEGQQVKKDQVLAQMEDTDLAKTLIELKSKADLAQKKYDRAKELLDKKATAPENFDQAKSDLEAANATVERTEAQLSYLKLIAPEDGFVIRRDGETGEMIAANQPVFWLSCCKPFRISSEVDEEDISLVQPGQDVVISADAFPDKIFNGKVQSITPKGDPVARSYRVRIELEDKSPLMIGMTAETNIITSKKEKALLVPVNAVRAGKIKIVQGNKIVVAPIEIGIKTSKAIEIKSGSVDDNVIVVMDFDGAPGDGESVETALKNWRNE